MPVADWEGLAILVITAGLVVMLATLIGLYLTEDYSH